MDDAATIIPIALSVLIVIIWAGYAYSKRRAEAFHSFARRRGLSFSKLAAIDVGKSFSGFRLFSEGFEKKVNNFISGKTGGVPVHIFDYSSKYIFRTGEEGQSPQTQSQTVLILQSDSLDLPSFLLYPKNILNRIFSALEKQFIDIQGHGEFSDVYVLKADNEDDIKRVFGDQVLTYLGKHRGLTIEGNGNKLVCYRSNILLKPDELNSFLEEGLELFRMMK
ncbi:MAG: hypothetical protein HZB61_05370 [Nitrospirae bacterium]|nr:hypothetical protein [Nitrospirota bacterium]